MSALRWRGLLAQERKTTRIFAIASLLILCVSLTFTQLGFFELVVPGHESAYMVLLLMPIALAALLLGPLVGTLIGLLAGAVLYAHSRWMPLDVYEMLFVDINTSVIMFSIIGFLLGVLFAFALRNNPSLPSRLIRIAIICFVISWLYTFGFVVDALAATIVHAAASSSPDMLANELEANLYRDMSQLDIRFGDAVLQGMIDACLMAFTCIVGDLSARGFSRWRERRSMNGLFNASLVFVVVNVLLVVSAVAFALVTVNERNQAFDQLRGNVQYIYAQKENNLLKTEALDTFLELRNVDMLDVTQDEYEYYERAISSLDIADGYSIDVDGIVFTSSGPLILMSNIPNIGFEDGGQETYSLDDEIVQVLDRSMASDEVLPFVFDGTLVSSDHVGEVGDSPKRAEFAYIYGKEGPDGFAIGSMMTASFVHRDRLSVMGTTAVFAVLLLMSVSGIVALLLKRVVLRRIDETNEVLERVTAGDLEARVEIRDTREFESLSDGINTTVNTMRGWIAEAETRMDAELATAKAIQESAIPRTFPPYPDIRWFDIYASMNPAKQVGGDFYDFFFVGEADDDAGKLAFVVADVSGKGVPAALFMMEAKTQIRGYVSSGMELGEAIENVNRQLCDGNDAGMFVTAWVGVLDYATGHVDYVNAGHNPPLLWSFSNDAEGSCAGGWRWLTERSGLPLGLFDGMPYTARSLECEPGDQFLLYSDGVTEAASVDEELYGEDRLEALLSRCVWLHPRQLVSAVRADVAAYTEGAEQSDDITILALEIGVPPEITATLVVPAVIDELAHVNDFIHTELDRRLCPLRVQNLLDVAVEELFVNVCRYAYADSPSEVPGTVRVSYTYSAEPPSITVDLADDGIPYNPLEKPDAATPDNIMDVPIGGLGILMAKRSVDEMRYERVDNSNVVSIVKKW